MYKHFLLGFGITFGLLLLFDRKHRLKKEG